MRAFQAPGYDSRCTKLSHILDTFSTGIYDKISAGLNINKLFRHSGVSFDLADYADSYVEDKAEEKDRIIQEAFKKMWHAEWEEKEMVEEGDTSLEADAELSAAKDGQRNLEAVEEQDRVHG